MEPEPTIEYVLSSCWQERLKTLGFSPEKGHPDSLEVRHDSWRFVIRWRGNGEEVAAYLTGRGVYDSATVYVRTHNAYALAQNMLKLILDPNVSRKQVAAMMDTWSRTLNLADGP